MCVLSESKTGFVHSQFPKRSSPSLGLSLELFCFIFLWTSPAWRCQLYFVVADGHLALTVALELQEDDSFGLFRVTYKKRFLMPLSSEDAPVHTIPNSFNPVNFGALNFQFKYSLIFIKEIREVFL